MKLQHSKIYKFFKTLKFSNVENSETYSKTLKLIVKIFNSAQISNKEKIDTYINMKFNDKFPLKISFPNALSKNITFLSSKRKNCDTNFPFFLFFITIFSVVHKNTKFSFSYVYIF